MHELSNLLILLPFYSNSSMDINLQISVHDDGIQFLIAKLMENPGKPLMEFENINAI